MPCPASHLPLRALVLGLALHALSAAADDGVTTPWGRIAEPRLPSVLCGAPLQAHLRATDGRLDALDENPQDSQPDQVRIQQALDACPPGAAVKLVAGPAGAAFLSGPLTLKSGVSLWIDRGVTLFASRNPRDYDNGRGTCGSATADEHRSCRALITATDTRGSGLYGGGVIEGRGGSLLTDGPNRGRRSWWDVAYQHKSQGLHAQNPRLLQVDGGRDFTLYDLSLQDAPNFHVVTDGVQGVTAWGLKILTPSGAYSRPGYACPPGSTPDRRTPATCFTPGTVQNTDGFDPMRSSQVLLTHSAISTGDDQVAIKAGKTPGSRALVFAHNSFYYGHGLSIGSETQAGVSDVQVRDLVMDGGEEPNGNGLRIKSNAAVGGLVRQVSYSGICLRGVAHPLVFDSFYAKDSGSQVPEFRDIAIHGLRDLGRVDGKPGQLILAGYPKHPLQLQLDDVVIEGRPPQLKQLQAAQLRLGPGPVSFADQLKAAGAEVVTPDSGGKDTTTRNCATAFVPLRRALPNAP